MIFTNISTEGEECPIVLWWPMREYNKSYLLISDFDVRDTSGYCVARSLNLSRKNFVSEESNCLTNFDWRGISMHVTLYYSVHGES